MKNKLFLLILFISIIAAAVSWPLYFNNYAAPDTVDIHQFPKTIHQWTSEEIPIPDESYAILETRNAFTRMYSNEKGEEVLLYMIYSQHNRKVAHPPEICYTGGGATIVTKFPFNIAYGDGENITVNRVLIDEEKYQQLMYYWFKVGNSYTPSYWRQQLLIGFKTLLGRSSSSALIRLTTTVQDDNVDKATQLLNSFSQAILPLIPEYLP